MKEFKLYDGINPPSATRELLAKSFKDSFYSPRTPSGLSKKRVLAVDDNNFNFVPIQRILENLGYEMDKAFNGMEFLEILRKIRDRCSFILMDIQIPVMDGIERRKISFK